MEAFLDVLLDAFLDTAKILPLLLLSYLLIELIEFKFAVKFQNNKYLKGKASPVLGSLLGCVPQCGFSVVSTDLYTRGSISVGALVAVYIATSDEAIPIMISTPKSIPWMLLLIAIKIVAGILVGYLTMWAYKCVFKKQTLPLVKETHKHDEHQHEQNEIHEHKENETEHGNSSEKNCSTEIQVSHGGCCHHHVETKKFDWLHPILHSLKIAFFILIINIIFGAITEIWIGKEALTNFLMSSRWVQPLLAVLIGLIPNCASSVVLTDFFLMGGLTFGALTAGLMVNAGLGIIILLKQNKNAKENLFILAMLIIPSLILGYALSFI